MNSHFATLLNVTRQSQSCVPWDYSVVGNLDGGGGNVWVSRCHWVSYISVDGFYVAGFLVPANPFKRKSLWGEDKRLRGWHWCSLQWRWWFLILSLSEMKKSLECDAKDGEWYTIICRERNNNIMRYIIQSNTIWGRSHQSLMGEIHTIWWEKHLTSRMMEKLIPVPCKRYNYLSFALEHNVALTKLLYPIRINMWKPNRTF